MRRMSLFVLSLLILSAAGVTVAAGPQPGDVYKEFYSYGGDWRVTDRATSHTSEYPNSTYSIDIGDLAGAIRAEAMVVRWGGHTGTSRRRIAFGYTNSDNLATFNQIPASAWIALPEITTTPGNPLSYNHFDNPVTDVPLTKISEGVNSFVLDCGPQVTHSFGWGQWGFSGMVLRVYYDPATKPHPTGRIATPVSGVTLGDNPVIAAAVSGEVQRVDFVGSYEGVDIDGDGIYQEWQEFWFRDNGDSSTPPAIEGHIGTAAAAPWQVTWSTANVPDQFDHQMKICARILGADGAWYVTEAISDLDLHRPDKTVTLFNPNSVPEQFWVRANQTKRCYIAIPIYEQLSDALSANMHWRTWAENSATVRLNDQPTNSTGAGGHEYLYATRTLDVNLLQNGSNEVEIFNASAGHGCEVMWPGPMLTITYATPGGDPLPIAHAGGDRTVADIDADGAELVALDASASTPPPGGTITSYNWTENGVELGTHAVSTTMLSDGPHTIVLTVGDSRGNKTFDTCTIMVKRMLVAYAGADLELTDRDENGYEIVLLDGTGSIPADNPIVTYAWLNDTDLLALGAHAATVLPVGEHTIGLEVIDSAGEKASDTMTVIVHPWQPSKPGDANLDGSVDVADFVILKNNFGLTAAEWADGDFDGDGEVGIYDFVILKNNFGR